MSYIKVRDLNFSYKDDEANPVVVLRDMSLDIEKGEYVAERNKQSKVKRFVQEIVHQYRNRDKVSL